MKTLIEKCIVVLIALAGILVAAGCGGGYDARNAEKVRDFISGELAGDTSALAVDARRALDTIVVRDNEDSRRLYSVINRTVFHIHHRGNPSDALRMNYGMLDILSNSTRRTDADTWQMLNMYVRLGASFSEGGMPSISLDYYMKGLENATDSAYAGFRAMYYNNIGVLYAEAKLYDKATEYLKKALDINLKGNIHEEVSLNYSNLAEMYDYNNDVAEAQKAVQSSLDHLDGEQHPLMLANMRVQQGGLYTRQGQYDVAMMRYDAALKQFRELDYVTGRIEAYLHISRLYLLRQRPDSAELYADLALREARDSRNYVSVVSALRQLSDISDAKGDYQRSVRLLRESDALDDSLRIEENQLRLHNWEALGNQIPGVATREGSASLFHWLGGVLILLVIGGLAFAYFRMRGRMRREVADGEKERRQLGHELDKCNRQLTTISLEKVKSQEGLSVICDELRTVLVELNPRETSKRERLRTLLGRLDSLSSEESDQEFKHFFEQVHPDFYKALNERWPDLTPRDSRLCAFLYLGLSTKEIASLTYREIRSVESARNRLRKKLGLDVSDDLTAFLHSLVSD